MAERMVQEAHWGYFAFALANAEVAEKGKLACIDTANGGIVIAGKSAAGLLPIGVFAESATGDGVKRVQVKLFHEIQATWWDNDTSSAVDASDRGTLCFLKDSHTVSADNTGRSVAGMVLDVDARKGVLVHFGYKAW